MRSDVFGYLLKDGEPEELGNVIGTTVLDQAKLHLQRPAAPGPGCHGTDSYKLQYVKLFLCFPWLTPGIGGVSLSGRRGRPACLAKAMKAPALAYVYLEKIYPREKEVWL